MSDLNLPILATPKKRCICSKLHNLCDPTTCGEASSSFSVGEDKPRSTFSYPWADLLDAADAGCPTCQMIRIGVNSFKDHLPDYDTIISVFRTTSKAYIFFESLELAAYELMQTSPTGKCLCPLTDLKERFAIARILKYVRFLKF